VKRRNFLFDEIASYANIRLAFLKAIRGKRASAEALLFCRDIEGSLENVRLRLLAETVRWGAYKSFVITDPKTRIITAAPFEDRVIHHAIMNVLDPVFEHQLIHHSYACRNGKGSHAAVRYAFTKCKAHPWFLKLDMRKYFDSIDHATLKKLLARIIKDKRTLALLGSIIDTYHTAPGDGKAEPCDGKAMPCDGKAEPCRGVPIGNLTSQYFANYYLSGLDHFIQEELKPAAYCRYMDDFVLWASTKESLQIMLNKIERYTEDRLLLHLKPPVLDKTARGLPFLGFMIKTKGIYLLQKSKRRMKTRVREIKGELAAGLITEAQAAAWLISVYAAVLLARTRAFRVSLWYRRRFGHEPGETRRQLEQQRGQLHGVQPQQQHPEQHEQQFGFSCCVRAINGV
jgi:retron-type reverse transcriptase